MRQLYKNGFTNIVFIAMVTQNSFYDSIKYKFLTNNSIHSTNKYMVLWTFNSVQHNYPRFLQGMIRWNARISQTSQFNATSFVKIVLQTI